MIQYAIQHWLKSSVIDVKRTVWVEPYRITTILFSDLTNFGGLIVKAHQDEGGESLLRWQSI